MPAATTQTSFAGRTPRPRQEGQERGRLKIFLGAAPGVGKTYAMLTAARAAKAEGRDVVVGLVETHGRRETEALLAGLEVLPRKPIVYVNKHPERVRHRRGAGAAAEPAAARRVRPHQHSRQPPSQALAGRRGAAGGRHRRVDDAQRPAPRRASTTSCSRSRASGCARPCRTACSRTPTRSCWSTCRPTSC